MIEDDFFREEVEISLRQASDGELVRIMQFIDRLPSRARLDDVVAPLRGRLALVRPARSLTLTRVLTLPVEDLLVDPACEDISPFVLPRDALTPLHQLALDGVGRAEAAVLEEAAQGATMDDRAAVLAVGRRLWPMAETAARRFLAALDAGSPLALPAGWRPAHRARLAMAADLLGHAETLTGFTDRLPLRPMPAPNGDSRAAACGLLAWAGGVSADMQRAALTILLRRADDPSAIVDLMARENCGMTADSRRAAQAAAAIECLREVEILAATTESVEDNIFAAADRIQRLAALAGSVQGAAPLLAQAGLSARRDAALDAAAALAAARFAGALSGPAALAFDAVLPADDGTANDDDAASAEAAARAVARIAIAGARLAGEKLADIARPWRDALHQRLLDAAARRGGDGWARLTAVMDGLRLAEIIFGPELATEIAARIAPFSIMRSGD